LLLSITHPHTLFEPPKVLFKKELNVLLPSGDLVLVFSEGHESGEHGVVQGKDHTKQTVPVVERRAKSPLMSGPLTLKTMGKTLETHWEIIKNAL
jgi:hypothetical protein